MTRLAEAESNKRTFSRMVERGVATNDVRSFVQNQANQKKAEKTLNRRMVKTSMKSKLLDACALVKQLRSEKRTLSKKLSGKLKHEKWRCKRILKSLYNAAKAREMECDAKNARKLRECSKKMQKLEVAQDPPTESMKVLSGVNVFSGNVQPEDPVGPMICDKRQELSEDEKLFLLWGPIFMARQGLNKTEFEQEILKMVAKHKYSNTDKDCPSDARSDGKDDRRVEIAVTVEEAKSRLSLDKSTHTLDPSKLRAPTTSAIGT